VYKLSPQKRHTANSYKLLHIFRLPFPPSYGAAVTASISAAAAANTTSTCTVMQLSYALQCSNRTCVLQAVSCAHALQPLLAVVVFGCNPHCSDAAAVVLLLLLLLLLLLQVLLLFIVIV
jgi:hypothetical protein